MLEMLSSFKPFRRAALINFESYACEGCESLVQRFTGQIIEGRFVKRRLGCYISRIGRTGVVFVSKIGQAVDVFSVLEELRERMGLFMMLLLFVPVRELVGMVPNAS